MPVLENITIRHKLTAVIMVTCIAALLLVGTVFITWEQVTSRRDAARTLLTQAGMVADNCKAAVAFEDAKDAEETLRSLHVEPSIVFACVYTKGGRVFASYYRDGYDIALQPVEIQKNGHNFDSGLLTVFKSIVLDEETIGIVCLRSDLRHMRAMFKRNTKTIIVVLLLSSLVAYLVSSQLQRIISEPILSLANVAKLVSERRDYNTRAVKHSNDEVGSLIDAFNKMLEQIQQRDLDLVELNELLESKVEIRTAALARSNADLEQFAYAASHDLQEPLRMVGSYMQLLKKRYKGKLDDDADEFIDYAVDGVERMQLLIGSLLDFSRVGMHGKDFEDTDCEKVLTQTLMNLQEVIKDTDAVITNDPLPNIVADDVQFAHLFQNLVNNAVKFHSDEQPKIHIAAKKDKNNWLFSVRDNGIGIDDEHKERIFQMFQRLHTRSEYEGTGIGLALCKKIVERHGGKIWVESQPDQGSTFYFTIPMESVKEAAPVHTSANAGWSDSVDFQSPNA